MNSQSSRGMHTKKLKQIREKKTYGGSKLTYENNFTIKKPQKTEMCQRPLLVPALGGYSGLSVLFI